ncbi:hypothetical protein RIF29_00186 [Crotalaria pallida]|uniref:Transcription factor TFIIB cyclin-like domain-containing protein n=1 Tax=Crotalaria pallida TaxID=3830 RepID=A0AAN9IX83_CROPI
MGADVPTVIIDDKESMLNSRGLHKKSGRQADNSQGSSFVAFNSGDSSMLLQFGKELGLSTGGSNDVAFLERLQRIEARDKLAKREDNAYETKCEAVNAILCYSLWGSNDCGWSITPFVFALLVLMALILLSSIFILPALKRGKEVYEHPCLTKNRLLVGMCDGDLNSAFFYACLVGRRGKNAILSLHMLIYKRVEDQKSSRGRNQDALLAACLYIACRQEDKPQTVNSTKKEIGRAKEYIVKQLGLEKGQSVEMGTIHVGDFMVSNSQGSSSVAFNYGDSSMLLKLGKELGLSTGSSNDVAFLERLQRIKARDKLAKRESNTHVLSRGLETKCEAVDAILCYSLWGKNDCGWSITPFCLSAIKTLEDKQILWVLIQMIWLKGGD